MKITKRRLIQIIKEESAKVAEMYDRNLFGDEDREPEPPEQSVSGAEVPPDVALMEDLWDLVRGFYKAGRSDVALKLQKIAEMADEGHERLLPRGEGTPGLKLPSATAQSVWDLKNKLGLG